MKQLIVVLVALLIFACQGVDKPKKPKNLISKDKMIDIMYDLYILNAAKGINIKALEEIGSKPQQYIYDKYDIDSLQFAQNQMYYAYDPKTYKNIVNKVLVRLQKDKIDFELIEKKEVKMKDSIKAAMKRNRDTIKSSDYPLN